MREGEQARGRVSEDPRGISGSEQRARIPLRGQNPGSAPAASPAPAGTERSGPAAPGQTDRQTDTLSIIPVPAALPSTTAKMLLLLLGIIVLHVTVLVLLFVSTIVSVSADCPCSGLPAARDTARQEQHVLFLFLPAFPAWLLAGSLHGPVAGVRNSGIGELGSLCCQGRSAVFSGGCSGHPRWYKDTRAVGNHLLILPRLAYIQEQPRSTPNPLFGGNAALPFHKGAPSALEAQDQNRQPEQSPERGWPGTDSPAQQLCSPALIPWRWE